MDTNFWERLGRRTRSWIPRIPPGPPKTEPSAGERKIKDRLEWACAIVSVILACLFGAAFGAIEVSKSLGSNPVLLVLGIVFGALGGFVFLGLWAQGKINLGDVVQKLNLK